MSITHWRERSHFQTSQGPICNLRVTHNTAWREKVTWRPQEQPWSFAQRCINPCRSLCAAPKQKPRPNFTPRKTPPSHYLLLFIASIAAEKAILRCFTNAAISTGDGALLNINYAGGHRLLCARLWLSYSEAGSNTLPLPRILAARIVFEPQDNRSLSSSSFYCTLEISGTTVLACP
jgi:hypothetical protein